MNPNNPDLIPKPIFISYLCIDLLNKYNIPVTSSNLKLLIKEMDNTQGLITELRQIEEIVIKLFRVIQYKK